MRLSRARPQSQSARIEDHHGAPPRRAESSTRPSAPSDPMPITNSNPPWPSCSRSRSSRNPRSSAVASTRTGFQQPRPSGRWSLREGPTADRSWPLFLATRQSLPMDFGDRPVVTVSTSRALVRYRGPSLREHDGARQRASLPSPPITGGPHVRSRLPTGKPASTHLTRPSSPRPLGGMADAGDLKSLARKSMPVRVRQGDARGHGRRVRHDDVRLAEPLGVAGLGEEQVARALCGPLEQPHASCGRAPEGTPRQ